MQYYNILFHSWSFNHSIVFYLNEMPCVNGKYKNIKRLYLEDLRNPFKDSNILVLQVVNVAHCIK